MAPSPTYTMTFSEISAADVSRVGGKNASLGELTRSLRDTGIVVPPGFATTIEAYQAFLHETGVDAVIVENLDRLRTEEASLAEVAWAIRMAIVNAKMPAFLRQAIVEGYRALGGGDVAVRSSATSEDLPEASFAGQLDTYLHVSGEDAVVSHCQRCFASLFTERAMSYREQHGFPHLDVALSVGIQRMVRSDLGCAGVMFTLDTESGFRDVIRIDAACGLGEAVVQGTVDPDEFMVFKPLLDDPRYRPIIGRRLGQKLRKMVYRKSNGRKAEQRTTRTIHTKAEERRRFTLADEEVIRLARWGAAIEAHYGRPMDIEWAKDGETGKLFVLQARPETVQSRASGDVMKGYRVIKAGKTLATGHAIGDGIAVGKVCRLENPGQAECFPDGAVLVTAMTDPDWMPVMRRAAAIVTDHGGRTSHAAIVSRELGLPAIVGAENATAVLKEGREITVSCAEGDIGHVYEGRAEFEEDVVALDDIPSTRTKVMLNLADPAAAFRWWRLPSDGVGLARLEFVISNMIKCHPKAFAHFAELKDAKLKRRIDALTTAAGYEDKARFFIETLGRGVARIAASAYPNPVLVRMTDFKTNEYAGLIGGSAFEPKEENPMLGWRGASRYYHPDYRKAFGLECEAIRHARDVIGLTNIAVMIPFCRTPEEADRVLEVMAEHGLVRGRGGLEFFVMCEVPSNVILAEEFAERFDGFSIGSNDLTQLCLGVDRDSDRLADLFDERNEAVVKMISDVIRRAHACGSKIGLCGQAPSDHPDFAQRLVEMGIDSISVTPDSFVRVKREIAAIETNVVPMTGKRRPATVAQRRVAPAE